MTNANKSTVCNVPLLSLVIPVYMVEEYIESCLHSVFAQIPDGVEVILVDDGTTDRSIDIVRRIFPTWIENGCLILLEQSNKGPGAARNAGIRKANGKYIGFLDSDDVLLNGYFDQVYDHLKSSVADIVEFGFKRFYNQKNLASEPYYPLYGFSGLCRLSEVRNKVFSAGCWFPPTRIYRREIFDRFQFPEGTHYEDLMLIPNIYQQDLMVYFIDKPLLGYRYNPASITSNHSEKHFREKYEFYKSISGDSEASKILKIKVARSMVYFQSELQVSDFVAKMLVCDIKNLRLTRAACNGLRLADRLFLQFPGMYLRLDALRVPLKKLVTKFRLQ